MTYVALTLCFKLRSFLTMIISKCNVGLLYVNVKLTRVRQVLVCCADCSVSTDDISKAIVTQ